MADYQHVPQPRRFVVSFKSTYQGQADYMVYDRDTHTEHRVRVDLATGQFPMVSGRVPTMLEQHAVAEYRHYEHDIEEV